MDGWVGVMALVCHGRTKGLDMMPDLLSVAFGTLNGKHTRLIQDKTKFVARMSQHAEFCQLDLQPSPRRLAPHHKVVIEIALGQELVHIRSLHPGGGSLAGCVRSGVALEGLAAKAQQCVIQVQDEQRLAFAGRIHKKDLGLFGKFLQILPRGDMVEPLIGTGVKVEIEIIHHLMMRVSEDVQQARKQQATRILLAALQLKRLEHARTHTLTSGKSSRSEGSTNISSSGVPIKMN